MSRKRNREESEKKVGAVLNPDEPPEILEPLTQGKIREMKDFGDEVSNEAKRPRLIRSFTGELIDEAKMAQLRKVL